MTEHVCVFPTRRGVVQDDATCPVCGRSVMDGFALFDLPQGDSDVPPD